jgi:hypothetical protein
MSENKVVSPGNEGKSNPAQNPITAINILLEPHATMIQHAQAACISGPQDVPTIMPQSAKSLSTQASYPADVERSATAGIWGVSRSRTSWLVHWEARV